MREVERLATVAEDDGLVLLGQSDQGGWFEPLA